MTDAAATLLTLRIEEEDADDERRADLAEGLGRELAELDGAEVSAPRGATPPAGAKSASAVALGVLVVALAQPELVSAVVAAVEAWTAGRTGRSVRIEIDGDSIEVTGLSAKDRRRLIDSWLERRSAEAGRDRDA
ncbi:effector-associated constant component EACC1 [Streptomyces xinghaiensis]|uniref:effector-associated constant component EACC1 n=1 Tax=Streptomyces xinghaiensis TaxID=1038928 RepID=UPI00341E7915